MPSENVPAPLRLRLPSGRRVAYRLYGPPAGHPVFYFHGTGGNGVAPHLHHWGHTLGLRFAAPDRPGYGYSDFQTGRRIADIAADVAAIADHVGWSTFACLGVSGGGPYGLACAWALPSRVRRAVVASGVGPPDSPDRGFHPSQQRRLALVAHRDHRRLARSLLLKQVWQAWVLSSFAGQVVKRGTTSPALPAADRAAIALPEVQESLAAVMAATRARDAWGLAWEMHLFAAPWGFALTDIKVPVDFWVGTQDRSISPAASRWMAEQVNDSTCTEVADAGHALPLTHWREMLAAVAAPPAREA